MPPRNRPTNRRPTAAAKTGNGAKSASRGSATGTSGGKAKSTSRGSAKSPSRASGSAKSPAGKATAATDRRNGKAGSAAAAAAGAKTSASRAERGAAHPATPRTRTRKVIAAPIPAAVTPLVSPAAAPPPAVGIPASAPRPEVSTPTAPAAHAEEPPVDRRPPSEPATHPDGHPGEHDPAEFGGVLAPPRPAPRRPGLIPTDIADALGAVLAKATHAIREHEAGSRAGGDIENVHQMRVATRRIRAYLKAAKPALDVAAADGLRTDLAELASTLGEVRDLDVMIHRMHAEAEALGDHDAEALERLIGSLDRDRSKARSALVAQLDDPDHESLLTELDDAAAKPPVADPWASLIDLAAQEYRRLAKAEQKMVRAYGHHPPDDDLHALRILGKRARYTAELLDKDKRIAAFLAALAHFQEVLGNHQDACVLEDQLRAMVRESGDVEAAIAAGRVIQGCRERREHARRQFPDAWKDVARAAESAYQL